MVDAKTVGGVGQYPGLPAGLILLIGASPLFIGTRQRAASNTAGHGT